MINPSIPEPECEVSGETPKEERVNFLTHFAGFALSLIGLVYLLYRSYHQSDVLYIVACWIYGATLVMMYGVSTYYHYSKNLEHKRIFKVIDHACIYILIAGSYTPFTLGPLREHGGLAVLAAIWTTAILGTFFKVFSSNRFVPLTVIIYLSMGWLSMFYLPIIIDHLPHYSIILLLLGGVAYSIGVYFYLSKSTPYNHAVWHLFVLLGSGCHYFAILFLI